MSKVWDCDLTLTLVEKSHRFFGEDLVSKVGLRLSVNPDTKIHIRFPVGEDLMSKVGLRLRIGEDGAVRQDAVGEDLMSKVGLRPQISASIYGSSISAKSEKT